MLRATIIGRCGRRRSPSPYWRSSPRWLVDRVGGAGGAGRPGDLRPRPEGPLAPAGLPDPRPRPLDRRTNPSRDLPVLRRIEHGRRPFDRETRDAIYRRAKGTKGDEPFGTERDVTAVGYEFLRHSLRAKIATDPAPRVRLGGPDCAQPYDIALLNVRR